MAFILRPDSNVTQTSWTNGYLEIDEATASDTDFAYGANNSSTATLEVGLQDPSGVGYGGTCTVRWRHAKVSSGTLSGTGGTVNQTCAVYEGTSLIASSTVTTGGTWTAASFTFDGSLVSDWTNIRLRFTQTASGAGGNARGSAVSWAELEVPSQSYSLTETETGTGAVSASPTMSWAAVASYSAALAVTATLSSVSLVGATLSAGLSPTLTAELQPNNGIRITEDLNRRVTQAGDLRVLQGYIAATSPPQDILSSLSASGAVSGVGIKVLNGSWSVSGAGTGAHVPSLIQNQTLTLVGSLATLSASTFTASAVSVLNGQATISSTAQKWTELSGSIQGTAAISSLAGYRHTVSSSFAAAGQISSSPAVGRDMYANLNGPSSWDFIPTLTQGMTANLSGAATGSGLASSAGEVFQTLSASGQVTATASRRVAATSTLTAQADLLVHPLVIQAFASLIQSSGSLSGTLISASNFRANLTSTATVNGTAIMIRDAAYAPTLAYRITESGDRRVTDTGGLRITVGNTEVATGNAVGTATTINFQEGLYAKKNGTWGRVVPWVKRNGTWVTPKVYIKQNDIWKRVY